MSSLLLMQRENITSQIRSIQTPGSLYCLVLDKASEDVIYNVLPKDQLLRVVASVDRIEGKRRHMPAMQAIYIVEISIFNLRCILADIEVSRYRGATGLFLPLLDQQSEPAQFFKSSHFIQNPAVLRFFSFGKVGFGFFDASYYGLEERVFLVDKVTNNSMPIYYNTNCGEYVLPQVKLAARALVGVMVVTGEYPLVRFAAGKGDTHPASRLPELLADEFQHQIDSYARTNPDFPPQTDRPRSLLLITDRTLDLYAPLLHEFTYQAMSMDIVHSLEREGVYKYESENERGELATLEGCPDEKDDDWVGLRHMHIIESSELITAKITDLIKNNPLMVDRSRAATLSDLMYVVAHLQGFDVERKQITFHRKLIDECLDINALRKLAEFAADFEQTCAAGGTSFEGVRNKHLHDDLITLLARGDLHVNDKMRLVLIYGLYRGGLLESDFVKLTKFIGVNDKHVISLVSRCFTNLHKMGFPMVRSPLELTLNKKMYHTINNEGTYNTSRFGAGVKLVLTSAASYQLDEEEFPYFRDKPLEEDRPEQVVSAAPGTSLRNTRIKALWASNKLAQNSGSAHLKQRVFCYVAGGITYSEMRGIYELSASLNKEVYIGSESILKPRDFLIGLQGIDEAKAPADLDLHLYAQQNGPRNAPAHLFEGGPVPIVVPGQQLNRSSGPPGYQLGSITPSSPASTGSPTSPKKEKDKKRLKLKSLFK